VNYLEHLPLDVELLLFVVFETFVDGLLMLDRLLLDPDKHRRLSF
jgi:hypothetical protein